VDFLAFEALPVPAAGMWVHNHDVFWPSEYPRAWVGVRQAELERRLPDLGTLTVQPHVRDEIVRRLPLTVLPQPCLRVDPSRAGGSLWFRKVG
jgi:hypothetical protein